MALWILSPRVDFDIRRPRVKVNPIFQKARRRSERLQPFATICCSSLQRRDMVLFQVFIPSRTQSDRCSSEEQISVNFIINRRSLLMFQGRGSRTTYIMVKISLDSSDLFNILSLYPKEHAHEVKIQIKSLYNRLHKTFQKEN